MWTPSTAIADAPSGPGSSTPLPLTAASTATVQHRRRTPANASGIRRGPNPLARTHWRTPVDISESTPFGFECEWRQPEASPPSQGASPRQGFAGIDQVRMESADSAAVASTPSWPTRHSSPSPKAPAKKSAMCITESRSTRWRLPIADRFLASSGSPWLRCGSRRGDAEHEADAARALSV